jgi:hypothetical protein
MLMWPRPGNPGPVYLSFADLADWQQFIAEFDLNPLVPQMMWDKYYRARKLYSFGWIDGNCIKPGNLIIAQARDLKRHNRDLRLVSLPRSSPWSLRRLIGTVGRIRRSDPGMAPRRCWAR